MTPPTTPIHIRLFVAIIFCLAGCTTMWALLGLEPEVAGEGEMLSFVTCAGIGAFLGGAAFAPMIGRDSPRAWLSGGLGSIFVTQLGAGGGGMILVAFLEWPSNPGDLYGLAILMLQMGVAAMFVVVFAMFFSLAGPLWLAMMVIAHFTTQRLRRDFPAMVKTSIFD